MTDAHQDPLTRAYSRVLENPALATTIGDMQVNALYKLQTMTEFESRDLPRDSAVVRLLSRVYKPYESFWRGYLGDAKAFASWASAHQISDDSVRLMLALSMDFPGELVETARRMADLTGLRPMGTWYIVHGPGWTNLGGFGDGTMVVDLAGIDPERGVEEVRHLLPHEINHLLFDAAHGRDPDRGTVLYRVLNEGFASYVSRLYWGLESAPAEHVLFSTSEWQWAVAHEAELFEKVSEDFAATDREVADRYVARNSRILPGAPGAIGYFIGYRIVEAYVSRHGPDSWRDFYDLPIARLLARSGYDPG